jgi:hypothetical protein
MTIRATPTRYAELSFPECGHSIRRPVHYLAPKGLARCKVCESKRRGKDPEVWRTYERTALDHSAPCSDCGADLNEHNHKGSCPEASRSTFIGPEWTQTNTGQLPGIESK